MRSVVPNVEALNRARCECVLTWRDVRDRAGIAVGTVTRMLKGDPVSVRVIRAVALVLGVEAKTLIRVEPEQKSSGRNAVA